MHICSFCSASGVKLFQPLKYGLCLSAKVNGAVEKLIEIKGSSPIAMFSLHVLLITRKQLCRTQGFSHPLFFSGHAVSLSQNCNIHLSLWGRSKCPMSVLQLKCTKPNRPTCKTQKKIPGNKSVCSLIRMGFYMEKFRFK